jgi:hypothetical protein
MHTSSNGNANTDSVLKPIFLLLVILLAYFFFRGGKGKTTPLNHAEGGGHRKPEEMVVCAHCQLRVPESEASVDSSGRYFCGDDHRKHYSS